MAWPNVNNEVEKVREEAVVKFEVWNMGAEENNEVTQSEKLVYLLKFKPSTFRRQVRIKRRLDEFVWIKSHLLRFYCSSDTTFMPMDKQELPQE